jgi:hypothetical protein
LGASKDSHIDAALVDEAVAYRAKEAGLNIIHLRGVPDSHTGAYAKKSSLQQKLTAITSAVRAMKETVPPI